MSGMLFLMFVQSMLQFGEKGEMGGLLRGQKLSGHVLCMILLRQIYSMLGKRSVLQSSVILANLPFFFLSFGYHGDTCLVCPYTPINAPVW